MEQSRPSEQAGACGGRSLVFIQGRSGEASLKKMAFERRPDGSEGGGVSSAVAGWGGAHL